MRKVNWMDLSPKVDPLWMTPSVRPVFPVSEHTCSRDDGVSLGLESCHPTVLAVIASGVHHSP